MMTERLLRRRYRADQASPSPSRRSHLAALVLAASLALALVPGVVFAQGRAHTVAWGETLSSISMQYNVSVEELAQVNGITDPRLLRTGQVLTIPTGGSSAPAPAAPTTPAGTYTVVPGDLLSTIAVRFGVSMYDLAAINGIANPDLIRPGQVLRIPGGGTAAPAPAPAPEQPAADAAPSAPATREHIVSSGETLSGIALQYGVSLDAIINANRITNPGLIHRGQRLIIPGGDGAVAPAPNAPAAPAPAPSAPAASGVATPGVCVHAIHQDVNSVLDAAAGMNVNWIKQQVEWKIFEPDQGSIRWDMLDPLVDAANARGMRLLLSVVKAPQWARPGDADISVDGPPADPATYAAFVGALAQRYAGRVHAYEIWNEQNLYYEWGGQGRLSASQYVDLLRAAYGAIKAADPNAVVVSGGLTPTGVNDGYIAFDDVHYLGQMYAAGARPYFDALGAHPSGYNNPPDDTPSYNSTETTEFKGHWSFYFRRFEQLRDVMAINGDAGKQIWFTEFGWSSMSNPPAGYEYAADNSEDQQARYLVRAFEIARGTGYVGPMFIWNLNFAPVAGPGDEKAGFSLIGANGFPRPAYAAIAHMPR